MTDTTTKSAPLTAGLPGIFSATEDHAVAIKLARKEIAKTLRQYVTDRAVTDTKWRAARKAGNYVLADRLKAALDLLPADAGEAADALFETGKALAPMMAGADIVKRQAYRMTIAALVRAHK